MTFAEILELHGKAVFFADAESDADISAGDNLVVLDPEWLAKAVGFVIEDKPTLAESGVLQHERLRIVWKEDSTRDCPGYDPALHGYLLWLMWKFDIAYRQDEQTSLIPQHIGRNRPDNLYWTPAKPAAAGEREAALICRIPHNPPLGLIPALTAAVHPLRKVRDPQADRLDRNWRDGFFLDTAVRGAAFVELRDRDLWLVVRDKYPRNLIDKVRETLDQIVQARWPQLDIDFRVPCIGNRRGKKCSGDHRLSWLEKNKGGSVDCEKCEQKVAVNPMLEGFDSQHQQILAALAQLKVGQRELLANAHAIFKALDVENEELRRAPCLFTVLPGKGNWNAWLTHETVRITCWCEHPDGPHPAVPIGAGKPPEYEFHMPHEWLVRSAPYISWTAMLLKAFVPPAGAVASQVFAGLEMDDLQETMKFMNDLSKALPSGKLELEAREEFSGSLRMRPEGAALRQIHDFLLANVKPEHRWGDLRPILTKSGQILWLCPEHAAVQQPPVQTI